MRSETPAESPRKPRADPAATSQRVRLVPIEPTPSVLWRFGRNCLRITGEFATPASLVLSDFATLIVVGLIAANLRHLIDPVHFGLGFPLSLPILAGFILIVYAASGLYSPVGHGGPEELRRLTIGTTLAIFLFAIVTFIERGRWDPATSTFLIAWSLALFSVPFARAFTRTLFVGYSWWGRKAVILSDEERLASRLADTFLDNPRLGIRPLAVITLEDKDRGGAAPRIPLLYDEKQAFHYAHERRALYAVVAVSEFGNPSTMALIHRYETCFKHWIIVPDTKHFYSLWVRTRDLDGVLGLEVTNQLFRRGEQLLKRVLDLTLTLVGGLCALPLGLVITLAIKLDSRGPVLYTQERIGYGGHCFRVYKFRSMVRNADARLKECLDANPDLRREWDATQKLKDDPRSTHIGKLLRKTSLDELPQLLNVLRGQMSLVGPRPIVAAEIPRYGDVWDLYQRVRPGISGQWQVSGRSETSYAQRIAMDAYYIRNWSIWLDIYILARTFSVVFKRRGAY